MRCKDAIYFLDYKTYVEALLRGFNVFVLSSVGEGMPRAMLEAMACGVPCIATLLSGIPEVINDENMGFLVPSKDSSSLALAMIKIATLPEPELDALIENAQNRVRQYYSHKIVGEKLKKLYESNFEAYCKDHQA